MEFQQLSSGRTLHHALHKVLVVQITVFLPSVEDLALLLCDGRVKTLGWAQWGALDLSRVCFLVPVEQQGLGLLVQESKLHRAEKHYKVGQSGTQNNKGLKVCFFAPAEKQSPQPTCAEMWVSWAFQGMEWWAAEPKGAWSSELCVCREVGLNLWDVEEENCGDFSSEGVLTYKLFFHVFSCFSLCGFEESVP
jgi:hypothetical protein